MEELGSISCSCALRVGEHGTPGVAVPTNLIDSLIYSPAKNTVIVHEQIRVIIRALLAVTKVRPRWQLEYAAQMRFRRRSRRRWAREDG